jgi:hypothetical protein
LRERGLIGSIWIERLGAKCIAFLVQDPNAPKATAKALRWINPVLHFAKRVARMEKSKLFGRK